LKVENIIVIPLWSVTSIYYLKKLILAEKMYATNGSLFMLKNIFFRYYVSLRTKKLNLLEPAPT